MEDETPPYAILSHTWGEEEVSFQDLDDLNHVEKLGYEKIEGCCEQAVLDCLNFVWIDTCCIDKRSSAELSEAINSMFAWYGRARVCYVYLEDVFVVNPYNPNSAFCKSRWFTRGWTLQELIAPVVLKFFNCMWKFIFVQNKLSMFQRNPVMIAAVSRITGIGSWHQYSMKTMTDLRNLPVATKLSWISRRSTTRVEDMAYSLLGLLGIQMPLLYGEGHGAFLRLQEELMRKYSDTSMLLWGIGLDRHDIDKIRGDLQPSCLAQTPILFTGAQRVCHIDIDPSWDELLQPNCALTPHGLRVRMPLLCVDARSDVYLCMTNYALSQPAGQDQNKRFAILVQRLQGSNAYRLASDDGPVLLELSTGWSKRNTLEWKTIYLIAGERRNWEALEDDFVVVKMHPLHTREIYVGRLALLSRSFHVDSTYPLDMAGTSRWVHRTFEFHSVMVFHRDRRDTIYLLIICAEYKQRGATCRRGPRALLCHSSYDRRRSAIEIWDSYRKQHRRRFCDPPQLNWQAFVEFDNGNRERCLVGTTCYNNSVVLKWHSGS